MIFGIFTLTVAIIISAVAAYYSIVGLTAIFSAAVIPIIIMGGALEIGKITAAVWLKINWARAALTYKLYLVPAVALLMVLTSMGIFGFLSKAHSDQILIKGDTGEQVVLYDEQIKVERETINNAKSLISQMDATVQGILEKGESREIKLRDGRIIVRSPAELALQVRRSQAKDRASLTKTIEESQSNILELQQKRAPFAKEQRKVEAEVGPIKYIAALIYGDNPDQNLLESAVRWVIIIIVAVFDPLALVLILAAQQSIRWHRDDHPDDKPTPPKDPDPTPEPPKPIDELKEEIKNNLPEIKHEYLKQPFKSFSNIAPMVATPTVHAEPEPEPDLDKANEILETIAQENRENYEPVIMEMPGTIGGAKIVFPEESKEEVVEKVEENPTPEFAPVMKPVVVTIDQTPEEVLKDIETLSDWLEKNEKKITKLDLDIKKIPHSDYWNYKNKTISDSVLKSDFPEVAKLVADNEEMGNPAHSDFGTQFPNLPTKGDMFVRIDYTPNKLYKYNGVKWIEIDKNSTASYTFDERYINHLIEKLKTGEMEIDDLSTAEQEQVHEQLQRQGTDENQ